MLGHFLGFGVTGQAGDLAPLLPASDDLVQLFCPRLQRIGCAKHCSQPLGTFLMEKIGHWFFGRLHCCFLGRVQVFVAGRPPLPGLLWVCFLFWDVVAG